MVPALTDVGAMRALADGVELERAGQPLEIVVVLAHRSAGLEPLRLGRGSRAGGGDLYQFGHSLIVVPTGVTDPQDMKLGAPPSPRSCFCG